MKNNLYYRKLPYPDPSDFLSVNNNNNMNNNNNNYKNRFNDEYSRQASPICANNNVAEDRETMSLTH